MSVDRFGVPDYFFGAHNEDFFGAIGRIASLAALIEHQALTIYQTLMNLPQTTGTLLSATQLIDKASKALTAAGDDENQTTLLQYFSDVDAALRKRNGYIHSLWPAQPANVLFGWRPTRAKTAPADKPNDAIQTNLEGLKAFISTLVEIVQRRDRVWVAAGALQEIKLSPEAGS
jgi:hypothetical protein